MESMKCQMGAGPMPPQVVITHGRKWRPRAAELGAWAWRLFRRRGPR